jgi:hypothetical protein
MTMHPLYMIRRHATFIPIIGSNALSGDAICVGSV